MTSLPGALQAPGAVQQQHTQAATTSCSGSGALHLLWQETREGLRGACAGREAGGGCAQHLGEVMVSNLGRDVRSPN